VTNNKTEKVMASRKYSIPVVAYSKQQNIIPCLTTVLFRQLQLIIAVYHGLHCPKSQDRDSRVPRPRPKLRGSRPRPRPRLVKTGLESRGSRTRESVKYTNKARRTRCALCGSGASCSITLFFSFVYQQLFAPAPYQPE